MEEIKYTEKSVKKLNIYENRFILTNKQVVNSRCRCIKSYVNNVYKRFNRLASYRTTFFRSLSFITEIRFSMKNEGIVHAEMHHNESTTRHEKSQCRFDQ